ncbi:MAG: DinB family protein [Bacteroidota bacterium]
MKQFILSTAFLLMTMISWSQASYLTEFKQKWANAKDFTLELAESMPESSYDYSPTEDQMSFKEQLLHITGNMVWLTSSYLGGEKLEADLKKEGYTKAEVLKILTDAFDLAAEAVENFPVEDLETEVKFFAGPMSKRQIMVLMNDHVVHHRGQIIIYARMKGIKPPRFRGW